MPGPERFSVVAPLPPDGAWRRALAVEVAGPERRRVVLAWVPQAILDDPERLVALTAGVEAAGRLAHPGAARVLGTETVQDAVAIVEEHREGTSLRWLLDAAGRLPADVAARVAVDACEALAAAHALAVEGKPLVHGALAPERLVVGGDGRTVLRGFGTSAEADPAADVRAVAAILRECLTGEPPERPLAPQDTGVPAALAAVVGRGLRAGPDAPLGAAELAEAIGAAGPVAARADVAEHVEALLPPAERGRSEAARALAAAAGGAPEASPVGSVAPIMPAGASSPGMTPSTSTSTSTSISTSISIPTAIPTPIPTPTPTAIPTPTATGASAPTSTAATPRSRPTPRPTAPEPSPEPLPRPPATRPGVDPAGVFAAPVLPRARARLPVVAALACAVVGFGAGLAAYRSAHPDAPPPVAAPRSIPDVAPASTTSGTPRAAGAAVPAPTVETPAPRSRPTTPPAPKAASAKPPARVAKPQRAAKPQAAAPARPNGSLKVSAPPDAEVFLDGRRVGRGGVEMAVPVGAHRVEVRRGEARVGESFSVAAGETWTYDVTPTPPVAQ